jgi:hypothetical protein
MGREHLAGCERVASIHLRINNGTSVHLKPAETPWLVMSPCPFGCAQLYSKGRNRDRVLSGPSGACDAGRGSNYVAGRSRFYFESTRSWIGANPSYATGGVACRPTGPNHLVESCTCLPCPGRDGTRYTSRPQSDWRTLRWPQKEEKGCRPASRFLQDPFRMFLAPCVRGRKPCTWRRPSGWRMQSWPLGVVGVHVDAAAYRPAALAHRGPSCTSIEPIGHGRKRCTWRLPSGWRRRQWLLAAAVAATACRLATLDPLVRQRILLE